MESVKGYITKIRTRIYDMYENTVAIFIRRLFGRPVSILFLGIDNAGKTTLLNRLKNESTGQFVPTNHSNKAEVEIGNMKVNIIDLGGHDIARRAWKDYFFDCSGIVFIVDVFDRERFSIVRESFKTVREAPVKQKPPVAVLFNKMDKVDPSYNAFSESDYRERFASDIVEMGIDERGPDDAQPTKISFVSIVDGKATSPDSQLMRAFSWLEAMINRKEKISASNA